MAFQSGSQAGSQFLLLLTLIIRILDRLKQPYTRYAPALTPDNQGTISECKISTTSVPAANGTTALNMVKGNVSPIVRFGIRRDPIHVGHLDAALFRLGCPLSPAANCTLLPAITALILFPQIMLWQPYPMVCLAPMQKDASRAGRVLFVCSAR